MAGIFTPSAITKIVALTIQNYVFSHSGFATYLFSHVLQVLCLSSATQVYKQALHTCEKQCENYLSNLRGFNFSVQWQRRKQLKQHA